MLITSAGVVALGCVNNPAYGSITGDVGYQQISFFDDSTRFDWRFTLNWTSPMEFTAFDPIRPPGDREEWRVFGAFRNTDNGNTFNDLTIFGKYVVEHVDHSDLPSDTAITKTFNNAFDSHEILSMTTQGNWVRIFDEPRPHLTTTGTDHSDRYQLFYLNGSGGNTKHFIFTGEHLEIVVPGRAPSRW